MGFIRENIDRWFENNIDVDGRVIFTGSMGRDDQGEIGVDHLMAEYFIKGIHVLESRGDKPITIIMNNIGGEWYHGMAIYDAIYNSKCYCTIKVYGHAMSMGSIILQAADRRIMMPNSRFMFHYGTDGIYGHSKIVERWSEESKRNNHTMEDIYLNKMLEWETTKGVTYLTKSLENISNKLKNEEPITYSFSRKKDVRKEEYRKILREYLNFDTILTPEETISIGLCDEIYSSSLI